MWNIKQSKDISLNIKTISMKILENTFAVQQAIIIITSISHCPEVETIMWNFYFLTLSMPLEGHESEFINLCVSECVRISRKL